MGQNVIFPSVNWGSLIAFFFIQIEKNSSIFIYKKSYFVLNFKILDVRFELDLLHTKLRLRHGVKNQPECSW